jgi:IS6 family transposase
MLCAAFTDSGREIDIRPPPEFPLCCPGCLCRPSPYINNIIEQDHRFIKKRINASLGFRSPEGAWRTIEGYEAMHLIRKGQVRWLDKENVIGQRQFIHNLFGIAA